MAINNPYQSYQKNAVTTASAADLTLMLYNAGIKFLHLAKKAIEEKNVEERNTNIQKVQNIIKELMSTLNMDVPVSTNLLALYDYMNTRLIEANINNNVEILNETEELLMDLRNTWKLAMEEAKKASATRG